jgi:uncharacterized protein
MANRPRPTSSRPSVDRRTVVGAAIAIAIVSLALLGVLFLFLNGLLVDRLWFESVGQLQVWDLRTFTRLLFWVPISALTFLLLAASVWLAMRSAGEPAPRVERVPPPEQRRRPFGPPDQPDFAELKREAMRVVDEATRDISPRFLGLVLMGVALVLALLIGLAASAGWETVLLWQHQTTTTAIAAAGGPGATTAAADFADPIFGRPLTFYLFDLPFYALVVDLVGSILVALILLTGVAYLVLARRSMALPRGRLWAWHLGILVALRVGIGAVGFQLDKYGLALQQRAYPSPAGVSATDHAVRIPTADVLALLTLLTAAVVLAAIVRRRWTWAAGAFGTWIAVAVGAGLLAIVNQALFVNPNPLEQERAFIRNDIVSTRLAYGFDGWTTRSYPASPILSAEAVVEEADTFANARLWDHRPLGATLDQLQTVRQYYDFADVDIDRYVIDGQQRQVMLSAREMALERNPAVANWLNTHFVYTHGYGVAMVPVNAVRADGLPDLVIRDMPVVSEPGAPVITEPRIYFGERRSPWIVTGALTSEFDYPVEEAEDATTRWRGTTGIDIGAGVNRLLLSIWTGDLVSFLTSPQITDQSQFLMRRSIGERLGALAPFLSYDRDPYIVVTASGRLVWLIDAYTTSGSFPLARALDRARATGVVNLPPGRFNYIRNSVKVVIDAYDGTTRFYVNDPSDPIVSTWASIHPTLFSPLEELPEELQPHLRYPEGLFNTQTAMFEAYHVTDPTTFFQGDNLWTVPGGSASQSQVLPTEAYYVQMRLPGADQAEYLLLQPMVPARRPNMIAWVAARNDGEARGEVIVHQLPADTTILGPAQIEARIDQTPQISSQVSLWDQAGSRVIRGNLIVVPVGDSFVYLEPIYLQSTGSAFPQFTKIVVATPSKVVWADTLAQALRLAVGEDEATPPVTGPPPIAGPAPSPGAVATPRPGDDLPADVDALIRSANEHFLRAQEAIGAGDYVTYGREMALVQEALDRLAQLTEAPPPE